MAKQPATQAPPTPPLDEKFEGDVNAGPQDTLGDGPAGLEATEPKSQEPPAKDPEPAKAKDAPVVKQDPRILHGRDWPEPVPSSRVEVAKGDFIVHVVGIGGREPHRGGWFKADSAVRVSAKVNILAVALEPFGYDPEEGALYHTVKNRPYKVFYTDPDKPQVVNAKIHEKVGDRRLNRVDLD